MRRLNKTTCADSLDNHFITFVFAVLDALTGELAYASAGHNAPIVVRRSGAVEMLEGGGTVLGILPSAPYSDYRAQLGEGDVVALYSDGVTEAFNPAQEEYGDARFIEILKAHRDKSAAEIVQAVTVSLAEWAAGSPPADDITLVVAKRI
jgi:phosphoserine phosphatase RsbU/P